MPTQTPKNPVTLQNGLIDQAQYLPSPNQDERPDPRGIDLLVIHNISLPPGEFQGEYVQDLFLNRLDSQAHPYFQAIASLRVSAHLYIRRDGQLIQFVPLQQRAWHAGVSQFQGRPACNDYAIGIELEGTDELPYSDAQYQTLSNVSRTILRRYPNITPERIVGHNHIAPERKTDPGPAFDWPRYKASLGQ